MAASGETVYQFRARSPVLLERARDQTVQMAAWRDGALVTVTEQGSTYTLLSPDSTAVISAQPVTVLPSGIATYEIQSSDVPSTLGAGERYQERWALVMPDGTIRTVRREAVLGLFALHPPVTQDDLVAGEYPDLVTSMSSFASTLQGFMDSTWAEVLRYLVRSGTWGDVVVEPSDVFDWYRHEVLSRIFKSQLRMQENERWLILWQHHRDEARKARAGLRITMDRSRDGRADHCGKRPVSRQVQPSLPARSRLSSSSRW